MTSKRFERFRMRCSQRAALNNVEVFTRWATKRYQMAAEMMVRWSDDWPCTPCNEYGYGHGHERYWEWWG